MTISHLDILKATRLGDSVAEIEQNHLKDYFVKTEAWGRLVSGEVDIIYGSKGAGKSALYLLLIQEANKMRDDHRIYLLQGENVSEDTVFKVINESDHLSESDFIGIWKLYVLALLGNYVRQHQPDLPRINQLLNPLMAAGLIPVEGLASCPQLLWND